MSLHDDDDAAAAAAAADDDDDVDGFLQGEFIHGWRRPACESWKVGMHPSLSPPCYQVQMNWSYTDQLVQSRTHMGCL